MKSTSFKPKRDFALGMDVGGTKAHILDSLSHTLHRYLIADYPDIYALLDSYFDQIGARPQKIVVAMAGLRDDTTGTVKPTNSKWPEFKPREAEKKYPGTIVETTNDMIAAVAGAIHASGIDLKTLKAGKGAATGTQIAVTISTGVNAGVAVWDQRSKQRIYMECEAGHVGFHPNTESEHRHLAHLRTKHQHPSVELAISGKHGMESWLEHSPELKEAPELARGIERAQAAGRPVGAVLIEFATEGKGTAQKAARSIMNHMGTLVGNVLADYALAYKATGGIYLIGSVSLALGEYWAEHTGFTKSFVR